MDPIALFSSIHKSHVLFMGPIAFFGTLHESHVLFQLTFIIIYSIFSKINCSQTNPKIERRTTLHCERQRNTEKGIKTWWWEPNQVPWYIDIELGLCAWPISISGSVYSEGLLEPPICFQDFQALSHNINNHLLKKCFKGEDLLLNL